MAQFINLHGIDYGYAERDEGRFHRGRPNVLYDDADDEVGFRCPGCGRHGMVHPPNCPAAVRMCADGMRAAYPADWRRRCLTGADADELLCGGRWEALPRHWRAVVAEPDEPVAGPPVAAMVWDGLDGVFREYHAAAFLGPNEPRSTPAWAGMT